MKYKYNGEWVDLSIKALDSMVIGSIIQFVGTTIPTGWLECDGSTITQSAYPELYDLIGGTLPDFRGRVLVGQDTNDTDFDTLGETGGSKALQQHNHESLWQAGTGAGTGTGSYDGIPAVFGSYAIQGMTKWNTKNAGTGDSGNLQPYAVVKHIIKATNTTPTMASIVNGYSTSTQDGYSCDYINDYYYLSSKEVITTFTSSKGATIDTTNSVIVLEKNIDNSIVKISGQIGGACKNNDTISFSTSLRPATTKIVRCYVERNISGSAQYGYQPYNTNFVDMTIATDGTVSFPMTYVYNASADFYRCMFMGNLIFMNNL